jgi:hypothetical protein
MPATVLLKDIVDELEMLSDEHSSYLDLESGEVVSVSGEDLRAAERDDDEEGERDDRHIPEWQVQARQDAKRILSSKQFLPLPSKFDVHEWSIMEAFANSAESPKLRQELLNSIHGSGAFRMFKHAVHRQGIEKKWYAFRTNALEEIARDWCEEHNIKWK